MSILCVHPKVNLLERVAQDLLQEEALEKATVILPHRRAVNFLEYYLSQKVDRPLLLPCIRPIEDWAKETYFLKEGHTETLINEYDQAYLVYKAASEVLGWDVAWDYFFPWALKLIQLFREFELELVKIQNLVHFPEDQTPPRVRLVLERLGKVYEAYRERLKKENFITPSLIFSRLAEGFSAPEGGVYIVGFYALTRTEDKIFRSLYEKGARIYWHADPERLPELYQRWKKEWKVPLESVKPEKESPLEIFFFEAHDLHAELAELKRRLPPKVDDPRPDQRAVVLLSSSSLIPLLYHLPEGLVNLSMGYPLRLTGVYTFLENLFSLVLHRDEKRGYPVREFIKFLHSPYLPRNFAFEHKLRQHGAPFVTREDCCALAQGLDYPVEALFQHLIVPLENAKTPRELASALRGAFEFLRAEEETGLFEKEFLASFAEVVLPVLEDALFAQEKMEKKALFRLLESLISSVQVPFEGEPLCGLQVLGLLETRLLSFREIFVLDLNEGVLPDVEEVNPLLPYGIREALGLPPHERDEAILRYHFERLVQTAERVHLFWSFQATRGEKGLEGKKIRSRYVERLIWEAEKEEGRFFEETEKARFFDRSLLKIDPEGVLPQEYLPKEEAHKESLWERIRRLSPSLLETYLRCPLRFFYQEVLGLEAPELPEEVAYDQLGTAVHEALQEFFLESAGGVLPAFVSRRDLKFERLWELFEKHLQKQPFYQHLSPARKFFLLRGAQERLRKYLQGHPENTQLLALERRFSGSLEVPGLGQIELIGQADRIDSREYQKFPVRIILDYKTGWVENISFKPLKDLDPSELEKEYSAAALLKITRYLPDLQLPFYVYLYCLNNLEEDLWGCTTAAYVELRKKGEEKFWFPPEKLAQNQGYATWLKQEFPALLRYLVRHIFEAPYWYPAIDDHACTYCPYEAMCQYSLGQRRRGR